MKTCKNCQQVQQQDNDLFCSACGQKFNLHLHSFRETVIHFIADYFHFDHKLWYTIKRMFQNCGQLSVDYIQGKVVSSYNPLSLYIFVSAIFFLIYFSMVKYAFYYDSQQAFHYHEYIQWNSYEPLQPAEGNYRDTTYLNKDSIQTILPLMKKEIDFDLSFDLQTGFIGTRYIGALRAMQRKELFSFGNAVEYFTNSFLKDIPKLFFILVPLFALILKLFIRKRSFMECLIFAVYFQCFMFIVFLLAGLLAAITQYDEWPYYFALFGFFYLMLYNSLLTLGKQKRWYTALYAMASLLLYQGALVCIALVYLHIKAFYL